MPLKRRSLKLGLAKTHLNDISSRTAFFQISIISCKWFIRSQITKSAKPRWVNMCIFNSKNLSLRFSVTSNCVSHKEATHKKVTSPVHYLKQFSFLSVSFILTVLRTNGVDTKRLLNRDMRLCLFYSPLYINI